MLKLRDIGTSDECFRFLKDLREIHTRLYRNENLYAVCLNLK